jgi:hypothetical protein
MHIEQDDVGWLLRDLPKPVLGSASGLDPQALGAKGMRYLIQDHYRVVVDK